MTIHYQRDQSEQVYGAEELLVGRTRRFSSLREIRAWLAPLLCSTWFHNRFPDVERLSLRSTSKDYATGGLLRDGTCKLTLPRWSWCALYILHELAHGVGVHNHGPIFCCVYLQLVRRMLGDADWRTLKEFFLLYKVRHRWPPEENLSRYDVAGVDDACWSVVSARADELSRMIQARMNVSAKSAR